MDTPIADIIFWKVLEAMLAAFAVRGAVRWLWARWLPTWRQWRRKGTMPRRTVGRLVVRP